jgi:hypothetical protein
MRTDYSELEIEHTLAGLLPKIQAKVNENYQKYSPKSQVVGKSYLAELKPPVVTIMEGRVYYKLVLENQNDWGGSSSTVYGFIRRKDGAIFRAATWRKPETRPKTAIRGHIMEEYAMDYFTPHGVIYAA